MILQKAQSQKILYVFLLFGIILFILINLMSTLDDILIWSSFSFIIYGSIVYIAFLKSKIDGISETIPKLEQQILENTEQIKSKDKELESFLYSVSHDLRAPLRTIDGFSLILLEDYSDELDEDGKKFLQKVRNGTLKLASLIEGMLQISRISRHELDIKTVNLSDIANKIINELQKKSPERELRINIHENLLLEADSELMEKVLMQLLENAWKFTVNTDNAEIEVGKNSEQSFYVKDNGVGFDMQYAKKLFNPFQRLHGNEYEGSGIGLAMSKKIIERHNGKITVEAKLNEGACFFFSL